MEIQNEFSIFFFNPYNLLMLNERYFVKKFIFGNAAVFMFTFGPLETNCYFFKSEGNAAIIDPSIFYKNETEYFVEFIKSQKTNVNYIINTHGHFDHIAGNNTLKNTFPNAKIAIHILDAPMLTSPRKNKSAEFNLLVSSKNADILLSDRDQIEIGESTLEVLHTPGHTKGSICMKGKGSIFSGDTIFAGNVGTAKGFRNAFHTMLNSIREKILTLPNDTIILPGHMGESTIGEEKQYNPFIQK